MEKDKKFTNREVIEMHSAFDKLKDLRGVKFMYALDRNFRKLEAELKSMQKSNEASEEFKEYETKRGELNTEYAKKDDDGNPRLKEQGGAYRYLIDSSRRKEYDDKMQELSDEYEETINQRNKEIEEYIKFLDEKNEGFEPFEIKYKYVPEDISWEQYKSIAELVSDEDEEDE